MNDATPAAVRIGLIQSAFQSQHAPTLMAGRETHDPTLKFVAQLVAHADDDELIRSVIVAALPENYSGDTLKELPGMIASARRKGFSDRPVSSEFSMTERGLIHFKQKGESIVPVFVSGRFETLGLARDDKSSGWSRYLRWKDADGSDHKYLAGDKMLLTDHDAVCGDLAHGGLKIGKGQQAALAKYILGVDADRRLMLVYCTGWHSIDGAAVFALPGEVIGDVDGRVIYEGDNQKRSDYAPKGMLSEWRQAVSAPAGDHALATLAISAAFARPLLQPAAQESGGIHIFGNSSTGKTTLLKLAASVWGDGGLVHSWRATSNGLEGVADRTSDVVLILDELGQLESREAATSLYMLAGGVGKIRMRRDVEGHSELARLHIVFRRNDGRDKDDPDARRQGLHGRNTASLERRGGSRARLRGVRQCWVNRRGTRAGQGVRGGRRGMSWRRRTRVRQTISISRGIRRRGPQRDRRLRQEKRRHRRRWSD
jgi:hypothetical protein